MDFCTFERGQNVKVREKRSENSRVVTHNPRVLKDVLAQVVQVLDDQSHNTTERVDGSNLVAVRQPAVERLAQLLIDIINGILDGFEGRCDLINGGSLVEDLGVGGLRKQVTKWVRCEKEQHGSLVRLTTWTLRLARTFLTLEASMFLFSTSVLVPAGRAVTMEATKGKAKRTVLKKSILF